MVLRICLLYVGLYLIGDYHVSRGTGADREVDATPQKFRKLLIFSRNDYLDLNLHPSLGKASAKVCLIVSNFTIII